MISQKCFAHSRERGTLSLLLYDVTTLYFECENEDDLLKVGYSKERRVDPQIVVGLLVDRTGFPLEISSFESNTAETTTIVPILQGFQKRHHLAGVRWWSPLMPACCPGRTSKPSMLRTFASSSAPARPKPPVTWPVTSTGTAMLFLIGRSSTPSPRAAGPRRSTTPSSKPNRSGLPPSIPKRGGRSGSTKLPAHDLIRKPSTPKKPAPRPDRLAIANVVKQLRPLRSATITINGTTQTFPPQIPDAQAQILAHLGIETGH